MNLDKTIKDLTNRLDVVHPYSASYSSINHQNSNDGVNYWKGKKIISVKDWNDLYKRNSTYTDTYKITLTSRIPLQYFPDGFNDSISASGIIDEKLKEEVENWNKDYYELLEYRKNSTWGRMKCSKCLLSGFFNDPVFIGIEKVFSRIITNHCNNNTIDTDYSVAYPCKVMNYFNCPFDSNSNQYIYTKEKLFVLQRVAFAIEQAISIFYETTKNNEIIYEVDFENDRVQEIHTKYNGEPESWGWQENVKEILSKVNPISNIVIRDAQDIYNILTNREKLESLLLEYEKQQLERQEKSKDVGEELDIGHLKPEVQEQIKIQEKEQQIILKQNQHAIIDFLLDNKDSIRIDDLKIYEPSYKCYKEKGICYICNTISNIICINCYNHNDKEVCLCTNHWQEHSIEKHIQQLRKSFSINKDY